LQQLGHEAVLLPLDTTGDADAGGDGKDRWVDAIFAALRSGEADLAVHSAKDLPATDPADLTIAAVPERADARDVLVAADPAFLGDGLPRGGARVGTSSLRRAAQLRAMAPDIGIVDLRGNVPTRIRKVTAEGVADVAVLAAAGLERLGLRPATVVPLEADVMTPAPGQGTLAIQCRTEDRPLRALLSSLDHRVSATTLIAEGAGPRPPGGARHRARAHRRPGRRLQRPPRRHRLDARRYRAPRRLRRNARWVRGATRVGGGRRSRAGGGDRSGRARGRRRRPDLGRRPGQVTGR
jgi:hypothetical protein